MLGVGVRRIVSPVNANTAISEGAPPSVLPVGRLRRGFRSATCGGSLIAAGIVTLTTLTLSRRSVAPSLRANRVSSMASSDGPDADRERELQGLWANAYDGWIDVPGESGGAIYTRPVDAPGGVRTHVPFPPIVTASRLFALTGFNPMGEERPIAENRAANDKLRADIEAMTPAPKAWWRAFGFAHDWREDGFVLAYEPRDGDAGEKATVDLAVKYGQGAIYAYTAVNNAAGSLRRRTVPAAMGQTVEADVEVERCDRPGLKFADPALPDEEY